MPKIQKLTKKSIIIGAATVLLLTGGASAYYIQSHNSKTDLSQKASQVNTDKKSPTSDKEKTAEVPKNPTTPASKQPKNPASTPNQSSGPTVTIDHVGQTGNAISIGAYSDYQNVGTCTVTFRHGASVVTKDVSTYIDGAAKNICNFPSDVRCVDTGSGTTACQEPFIKRSDFPVAGQWEVVVTFTSGSVSAQSAAQTITIT